MSRPFWFCVAIVLALAIRSQADEKKDAKEPAPKSALDRLKKLEGTWVAADKDGKPTEQIVSVFKVTAAGSAVQETIYPGTGHEMVTLYHLDGRDLILTHYCALGNQPKLKLDPNSPKDEFQFKFNGGTNLDPAKDMHMHEGSIKFVADDQIEWTWQGWADGKPAEGHKMGMTLVRKK
jgi:hypothetical protein